MSREYFVFTDYGYEDQATLAGPLPLAEAEEIYDQTKVEVEYDLLFDNDPPEWRELSLAWFAEDGEYCTAKQITARQLEDTYGQN